MKKIIILLIALLIPMVGISFATIINGGFESGLDGWSINITGRYWESAEPSLPLPPSPPLDYDQINVSIELGASILNHFCHSPVDGNSLLILQAGNYGAPAMEYVHTDGTRYHYYLVEDETWTLSQDVYLSDGDIISGYSALVTEDYVDRDRGWVEISDGASTYEIWEKSAGEVYNDLEGEGFSDWEYWEWQAPHDGLYRLKLSQYGDDQLCSWSLNDNIQIQPAPIPESSTMLLLVAGLIGISGFRKKLSK